MKRIAAVLVLLLALAMPNLLHAQDYVTWNPSFDPSNISGSFPGGSVTVTITGTGNDLQIQSPPFFSTDNVEVTGDKTFSTFGPNMNAPSKKLTFTFSTPVIVTRYNMADIDKGSGWDDTFNFSGIMFSSVTSTNCSAMPSGVSATTDVGDNAEYASWFMSTTAVSSFSLDYSVTDGLTHAYLCYSLQVKLPDTTPPTVTVNSPSVCSGLAATLTATPGSPGTYNYAWSVPSGASNPGNTASFSTSVAGVYSVIITNTANSLSSLSASGTVTLIPQAAPVFLPIAPVCYGSLQSPLESISENNYTGSWSPAFNNTASATYTFTPDPGQCAHPVSMQVSVRDDFDFYIDDHCQGNDYVLTVAASDDSSDNFSACSWTDSNGNFLCNGNSLNVTSHLRETPQQEHLPQVYYANVTDANLCQKTKFFTVESIFCGIQKGISPNGDNLNDTFDLSLLDVSQLEIFNRYGLNVYSNSNYSKGWDGKTDDGQELPDGVYYYVISFKNNTGPKTGWIYINRKAE